MTWAVIAIALALPAAGLFLFLQNIRTTQRRLGSGGADFGLFKTKC